MTPEAERFLAQEVLYADVGTAQIAYRRFGSGPPIVMLHGWPLGGFTYRFVLPDLSARYTCFVVDLPGAGSTRWRDDNDFKFAGQARNMARFVETIGLQDYHIVAHDTGATIARQIALIAGGPIRKLVLINTEIPHHRPPWIPLHQTLVRLPGSGRVFRTLLRSRAFVRSSMAFGNCFVDRRLLWGEFEAQFIRPLIESADRMEGQIRYLLGIDWKLVDSLAEGHARIANPVLLVWGADDPTFPQSRAEAMIPQFANCKGRRSVPGAKLLVHEEKPEAVSRHILEFLSSEPA